MNSLAHILQLSIRMINEDQEFFNRVFKLVFDNVGAIIYFVLEDPYFERIVC